MSRWAEPLRSDITARRRTASLSSWVTSSCSAGRIALTTPGWSRERSSKEIAPSPGRPGSGRRARAAAARSSGGSGTGRLPGTRPPARGSRASAPPPRPPRPRSSGGWRARAPRRAPASSAACAAASASVNVRRGVRGSADVARRGADQPAGPPLLDDVGRPAGDTRAAEHRRVHRRRDLGELEHDGGPELDVRLEHAVRRLLPQRRERGALERLGDLDPRSSRARSRCAAGRAPAGPRRGRRGARSP